MIKSSTQNRIRPRTRNKLHTRTQSTIAYRLLPNCITKKKSKKTHRRTASSNIYTLVPLIGNQVIKAPKIYQNQIFSDVYDEIGNHDRIVEISTEVSQDYDYNAHFIVPELLLLPSAGRNVCNRKKVAFFR